MSVDKVSFSNVMLTQTGKKGVLKQLDGGYYEIILGAFGTQGNGGWFYNTESAMRYINQDKEFMYMLTNGRLRSEWGHPVREHGMSDQDWFARIHTMYEPNCSAHIRAIRPSMNTVKDASGRFVTAIIGEVKPSGKAAGEFREQLENPHEDVNFSVRSFAKRDFRTMHKHINKIITWDNVFDPGVKVASKYSTPSMESSRIDFEDPMSVSRAFDEYEFNLTSLRQTPFADQSAMSASFESHSDYIHVIDRLVESTKIVSGYTGRPISNFLKY